jgi:hypothetical protein
MEKEGKMGKRKIKNTPAGLLVALLALFLSTGIAAAFSPVDPNPIGTPCVLVKSSGATTGVTVTAAPLTSGSYTGMFPIPGAAFSGVGSGSVWRYRFSGTGTQFAALIPVCEAINDQVNSVNYTGNHYFTINGCNLTTGCYRGSSADPVFIYPPGNTLTPSFGGWGIWDGNENIYTQVNMGGPLVAIGTDNDAPIPLRRTSMQFKQGNDLVFCANIAGPGCYARQAPPPPLQNFRNLPSIPTGK